jgi:hypothetical protein
MPNGNGNSQKNGSKKKAAKKSGNGNGQANKSGLQKFEDGAGQMLRNVQGNLSAQARLGMTKDKGGNYQTNKRNGNG